MRRYISSSLPTRITNHDQLSSSRFLFSLLLNVNYPQKTFTTTSSSSLFTSTQHDSDSSSSSAELTTKLKVDPMSEGSASNLSVQRHTSDAALKKTAKISSSLPKFGTKAKELEKKRRIEQVRRKMQMMKEEEEFLSATTSSTGKQHQQHFHSKEDLQKAEDDAWSKVNEKYGFAVKPGFFTNYRSFLYELQKFELNLKVLTASEKVVYGLDFIKTANNTNYSNSEDNYYNSSTESTTILESLASDASEANSFGQMMLWTENVLEALHFGRGVSDLRRMGTMLIPFAIPAQHMRMMVNKKNDYDFDSIDADPDDVSTFKHTTNFGELNDIHEKMRQREANNNENHNSNKSFLKFLKVECKMHPDTPNSVLFPPTNQNNSNTSTSAVSDGTTLAKWAVVTVERDDTEEQVKKMKNKNKNTKNESSSSVSYRSPLLDMQIGENSSSTHTTKNTSNDENFLEEDQNNNSNIILSVSLQTWTYMILSALIAMLNRNDIGVVNYELVSSLHSQKQLEPSWHKMRKLSGMHARAWPVDPRLLWYPGKK